MGKSTISMAMFNSYVKLPEGIAFWRSWVISFPESLFIRMRMHLKANTKANTSIFWQVVRHFIDKLWAWVEVRDHLGATCDPCFVQFSRKGHVIKAYPGEAVPVHDQAEGREMAPVSLYSLFLAMWKCSVAVPISWKSSKAEMTTLW